MSPVLEDIEWEDTWFDRMLQRILKERIVSALNDDATALENKGLNSARKPYTGSSDEIGPLRGQQGHLDYDDMIKAAV